MSSALPQAIERFLQAGNRHDTEAMLACFAEDQAAVADDGHEYRGLDAIKAWSDSVFIGARVSVEVANIAREESETVVSAIITGDYPNGPYRFRFHFLLDDQSRILKLTIREEKADTSN